MKEHLILDASFTLDDNYLFSLIETAESILEMKLGCKLSEISPDGLLPTPLCHAIKLLVSNWYENREPLSSQNLYKNAFGIEFLISPYKKY